MWELGPSQGVGLLLWFSWVEEVVVGFFPSGMSQEATTLGLLDHTFPLPSLGFGATQLERPLLGASWVGGGVDI
jgi:hypothetical protein